MGEKIRLSLERAIESRAIRIPIFSEGYADSGWCLTEAAAMLTTSGLIIPLLYYVDLKKGLSLYKQSYLKHYSNPDRFPREEIDELKGELQQICYRSGWAITEGLEAQPVQTVVNDLIIMLGRLRLEVTKHPVGMDSVKKTLIQKLNLSSVEEVVKVGILGIGGIGKTIVLKAVYN